MSWEPDKRWLERKIPYPHRQILYNLGYTQFMNILDSRRQPDDVWLEELRKMGVGTKGVALRLGPYIDFLTRVLEPLQGIIYSFEIMVFAGFIYEEAAQIYSRLALKYMCPLAMGRIVIELYPRLVTVAAQIYNSVTAPEAFRFPGARALKRYADAVSLLVWAIEQIGEKEGESISEYWEMGNPEDQLELMVLKGKTKYVREMRKAIEKYKDYFGKTPGWL